MKQFLSFNQTIRIRMLLKFFTVLTQTTVMPYTVVYFSAKIGPSLTTTMIIFIGIISMTGYLIGGRFTDSFGRKRVIITSEIIAGIGFIIVGFFDSLHYFYAIPILISFSFVYFFESAANPAYAALIIDASNDHNRKIIYTYFMWFSSVAFAVGSLLGGFLFENYSFWLFFLVGITSLISAIFTKFLIKEEILAESNNQSLNLKVDEPKKITNRKPSIINLFSHLFIFLCIGQLLLNILKEQFPNYLSIRIVSNYPVEGLNISGYQMIGYLNLEDTIIITLGAGIILKLTRKLSDRSSLIIGLLSLVVGYIFLSYFIHPVSLLLGMMFISVGGLIYLPTLQAITAKAIPKQSRGTHLSILGLVGALGGLLSSFFILGMEYIPEIGITYIFISIGILVIYIYINVYKLAHIKITEENAYDTNNYSKSNVRINS
ncbi:MFS transporter [Bacillus sp. AK128]